MGSKKKKNWLEWMVLFLSGTLVFFILGFLIYETITEKQTAPDIEITHGKPEHKENYWALAVTAKNKGTKTAENLHIEIIIGAGDKEQIAEIEFLYLPGRSSVNGSVTFVENPGTKPIRIHVLGYGTP